MSDNLRGAVNSADYILRIQMELDTRKTEGKADLKIQDVDIEVRAMMLVQSKILT
jgi:hypothetical protein